MAVQTSEPTKPRRRTRWLVGALMIAVSLTLGVIVVLLAAWGFVEPEGPYEYAIGVTVYVLFVAGLALQYGIRSEAPQLLKELIESMKNVGPVSVVALIATAAVLVAFLEQPYGYYMLLRLFLCGASLFLLAGANLSLSDWERWALGGFAVLYNPIVPIRIGEKDIWEVLNVVTLVLFWVITLRRRRSQSPS